METASLAGALLIVAGTVAVVARALLDLRGIFQGYAPGIQDLSAGSLRAADTLSDLLDRAREPSETEHLQALEREIEELRQAVAHGIAHVERTEARIRATVGRAQKDLDAIGLRHPGVEAEAQQIRLWDGGGGEAGGMPPVPAGMGGTPEASSIPGVTREALMKARGLSA